MEKYTIQSVITKAENKDSNRKFKDGSTVKFLLLEGTCTKVINGVSSITVGKPFVARKFQKEGEAVYSASRFKAGQIIELDMFDTDGEVNGKHVKFHNIELVRFGSDSDIGEYTEEELLDEYGRPVEEVPEPETDEVEEVHAQSKSAQDIIQGYRDRDILMMENCMEDALEAITKFAELKKDFTGWNPNELAIAFYIAKKNQIK